MEKYEELEIEVICFETEDVIMSSCTDDLLCTEYSICDGVTTPA